MMQIVRLILTAIALLGLWGPLNAQENRDIRLAEQTVLRIEVRAFLSDGSVRTIGHGTGFVVAQGKVITNHHVAEPALRYPSQVELLAIPAAGGPALPADVEAYNIRRDLALLSLDTGALPQATLFAGAVSNGSVVTALGYPGAVDTMAMRLDYGSFDPTRVTSTTGRIVSQLGNENQPSSYVFDAAMARGSSGGPTVDECGRVLLINTVQTNTGAGDANFRGGASSLVLLDFLREQGVVPVASASPCVPMATFWAQEKARLEEEADTERARQVAVEMRAASELRERQDLARDVYQEEWNAMALRLALLGFGAVIAGGLALFWATQGHGFAKWAGSGFAVCLLGAGWTVWTMPELSDYLDEAQQADPNGADTSGSLQPVTQGRLTCTPVVEESRVIRRQPENIQFEWRADGCIDNSVQYIRNGTGMEALFVYSNPGEATKMAFDPVQRKMREERYLLLPEEERSLAAAVPESRVCTRNPSERQAIEQAQSRLQSLLPREPNEVIVYKCHP
jgi:signal transduction histidine kinase